MKVHWITLDLNSSRAKKFIDGCKKAEIEHEPLVVVRGDTSNISVTGMLQKLSKPELGCMSSHLKMLDLAAQSYDEWFLICEDDADFGKWIKDYTMEEILGTVNSEANIVKFHMHALPLLSDLGKIFDSDNIMGATDKPIPKFIKTAPLDNIAYAIKPSTARHLVEKYKREDKWFIPGIPVDVWYQKLVKKGELCMYAAPIIAEAHNLDSSLTGSKIVLRLRKVGDEVVYQTTQHPTTSKVVYGSRLVKQTVEEFRDEILLSAIAATAVFAVVCFGIGVVQSAHK